MSTRDIALIDELRQQSAESSGLEFKKDNIDARLIGKLCSALANAARIENNDLAYILWGVDDETHQVVGSKFDPETKKEGNQVFQLWLAQRLKPSIAFSFRKVAHPQGNVVILEIPAATSAPVEFDNIAYTRIGSATPKLVDYPDRFQKLIDNIRPYTWEQGSAKSFLNEDDVLELLDYTAYFKLTGQRLPDNRESIFEHLSAEQLVVKDVGGRWKISNLAAILFATDLNKFDSAIARKGVRCIRYKGNNKATTVTHRQDSIRGYAAGFEEQVNYINNLLPKREYIGVAFRGSKPLYPELAIREIIANALIHQDMTIRGTGPQIELFPDRIEITNPGKPLVHPDRMIDLPPRSRNESLASLMRRMNLCEEQGSGLDKVIISIELYQLPAPKLQAEDGSMQVILYSPRSFANMTQAERIRACYQHTVIKYLSGERMKNASLCQRFGIESKNAAQASQVIKAALSEEQIKVADPAHPRAGYVPCWA